MIRALLAEGITKIQDADVRHRFRCARCKAYWRVHLRQMIQMNLGRRNKIRIPRGVERCARARWWSRRARLHSILLRVVA